MTTIAFQGSHGAFSDLVARKMFPRAKTLPCVSFEDTFAALKAHEADFAAIPVENSIAGRVSDVYHLLPRAGMFIHGEHFEAINHCLLGLPRCLLNLKANQRFHKQLLRLSSVVRALHMVTCNLFPWAKVLFISVRCSYNPTAMTNRSLFERFLLGMATDQSLVTA